MSRFKEPKELYDILDRECSKNVEIPIGLIRMFMCGGVTTAFTGRQGAGKNTTLISAIKHIPTAYTIKLLERDDNYLGIVYPERNIIGVSGTKHITSDELYLHYKSKDASVLVANDINTDESACKLLLHTNVNVVFSVFSHHSNTTKELIDSLSCSLVNAGGFKSLKSAECTVVDKVKIVIHLDFNEYGIRYIDRISEVISTDSGYIVNDIIKYDLDTNNYIACKSISESLLGRINSKLTGDELEDAKELISKHWIKQ